MPDVLVHNVSGIGLEPNNRWTITWNNADLPTIWPLGTMY